ncbi:MAG: uncharacterized protein K0S31_1912 [Sphingobacterium multivorum]|jgi:hypothetical protein|nr:uncharacterized protein [Sphingobacterium multivorum]
MMSTLIKAGSLLFVFCFMIAIGKSQSQIPQAKMRLAKMSSYSQLMESAGKNLKDKLFQAALNDFKVAFMLKDSVGKYDYANAMVAAANADSVDLAIAWFEEGIKLGLGITDDEYRYFLTAEEFQNLKKQNAYQNQLDRLSLQVAQQKKRQAEAKREWLKKIQINSTRVTGEVVRSGFVLYWNQMGDSLVPYLVYLPAELEHKNNLRAIVYLHGGVSSATEFQFEDPSVANEPIFKLADRLGFVVIYPFGKKSYGWVRQRPAFQQVLAITEEVKLNYSLDSKEIYLGGMSNGGTAVYWFATQNNTPFSAFFTLSADCELVIEPINWGRLQSDRPIYSFHAADDTIYPLEKINAVFASRKSPAWHLRKLKTGGHGFIYDSTKGHELFMQCITEMLEGVHKTR